MVFNMCHLCFNCYILNMYMQLQVLRTTEYGNMKETASFRKRLFIEMNESHGRCMSLESPANRLNPHLA